MRALALLAAALLVAAAAGQTFTFDPPTATVVVGQVQNVIVTAAGCPQRGAAPDDGTQAPDTQAPVPAVQGAECSFRAITLALSGPGGFVREETRQDTLSVSLNGDGQAFLQVTSDEVGTSTITASLQRTKSPETGEETAAEPTTPAAAAKVDASTCTITWIPVAIQVSTRLTQPQLVNTVQQVTAAVPTFLKFLIFKLTGDLAGLELVATSCRQEEGDTREQGPVKANAINLCNVPTRQQGRVPAEPFISAEVLRDGTAWIQLVRTTGGNTSVSIEKDDPNAIYNITGAPVFLAWSPPPPIPAKVLIGPKKAHKRCYEEAQVVARVLDADGAPVPDQLVTFGVTGSCVPRLESRVVVTDANGYAHLSLTSSEPGVAVVVAATVGANGNAVLSRPSHIVFEEEHHYDEDKAAAHTHGASDSDEEEAHRQYAADAARLALAEVERLMSSKTA